MQDSSQGIIAAYEAIFQNDFNKAHSVLEAYPSCSESLLLRARLFFKEANLPKAFSFAVQSIYKNPMNKRAWALTRDTLCHLSPPLSEITTALLIDLLNLEGLDYQKLSPYISKVLSPLAALPLQELEKYPLYITALSKMLFLEWEWEEARDRHRHLLLQDAALESISLDHLAGLSYQFYISDHLPLAMEDPEFKKKKSLHQPRSLKALLLKSCFVPLKKKDFEFVPEKDLAHFQILQKRTLVPSKITTLSSKSTKDALLQQFYEQNPYPRFETLDLLESPFPKHVELSLEFGRSIPPLKRCLVAGVGTGYHLLELATSYKTTHFVGIDLSKKSLQFARAKAAELRKQDATLFQNTEFIQADLIHFKTDEPFDWVECVGVIHHLQSPKEGWMALHRLCKEKALLLGGVYHTHARQLIGQYKTKEMSLENLRTKIAKDPAAAPITNSYDFYSLHSCKDLLLHPRETHYTLSSLLKELEETHFQFIKIEFSPIWHSLYRKEYPEDFRCSNISSLLEFEKKHPEAFNGMILFWAQKA